MQRSRIIDGRKRGRLTLLALAGLACVAWATACGDGAVEPSPPPPPPPDPARPTSVTVEPSSATLTSLGETVVFRATVKDQRGGTFPGTVTWSSSDETVVTVNAGGTATAVANGSGTVTATFQSLSATAAVEVAQAAASLETVSGDGQTARVGAVLPDSVVVRAVDAGGSPVAGVTVVFATGDGHGTADPAEAVTDTAGLVRTMWTLGDVAGPQTLAASVADGPSARVAARGLTAVEVVHTIEVVSGDGQTADLGAALGDSVVVRAVDAEGAPVEGAAVAFTPGEGHGTADPAEAVADTEGLARTAWTLGKTVGEQTLLIAVGDVSTTVRAHTANPDRAVLEALYAATRGLGWINNENWLTDAPMGEWYGVKTDGSGRVVKLELAGNGLAGVIPPELGNLKELQYLDLRENQLTGPIPPELGELTELEALGLRDNRLSGPIPAELGNLRSLRRLELTRNQLTGPIPPELGNLASLSGWLWLGSNHLTGPIPPELGKLSAVSGVILSDNMLSGPIPSEIGNLHNLVYMHLSGNELTGPLPQSFLGLQKLEDLLTEYGGRGNAGLCVPATAEFREWARQVKDRGAIDRLPGPFCDAIDRRVLEALYDATGGVDWTRSDGWLEDDDLGQWWGVQTDSVGRVSVLDLAGNGLSGHLPEALGRLANLRELRIRENPLVGRLPLSLAGVPLEEFDYRGTSLCVVDDAEFGAWLNDIARHSGTETQCPPRTDREILELLYRNTDGSNWRENAGWLTDAPLAEWHGVETDAAGRVIELRLGRNGLSGSLPVELGQLSDLTALDLRRNELSGSIPPELRRYL